MIVVTDTGATQSTVVLAGPDIVSRGFVYVRESEDLMEHAKEVVENALDSCLDRNITDWGKIKNVVKDALSDFLWKENKEKSDDPADHHGSIRHEAFTVQKGADMGNKKDQVGAAGVIVAGGFFKIALYVCVAVLVIWIGKVTYQFGYNIFNQQAMSPGEGQEVTVVIKRRRNGL